MRFEEFLKEREYLLGVSKKTLVYYRCAFNSWEKYATDGKVITWILGMKNAGISNISINTYICAMNAYFKWAEPDRPRIAYLKEEQKIIQTFSTDHVRAIMNFKAKGTNLVRARLVALTILDTGLRISEVLGLTKEDIDMDGLTMKVLGKGGKYRVVPFSCELRKVLYRGVVAANRRVGVSSNDAYAFCTKNDTQLSVRNFLRDFKILGKQAGITGVRISPHTLRHTFAVMYLRRGGNLEFLRRILGHSSILTTQKYLRSLGVTDLVSVHGGLSPLAR